MPSVAVKGHVLSHQCVLWLGEDAHQIDLPKRLQLDTNGKASL